MGKQERLIGIDILRLFAVLMVFLFHANMHIGVRFGFCEEIIKNGAMFMTTFYIISGFVLTYTNCNLCAAKKSVLKNFYIKRFIGIVPMYYFCAILFTLMLALSNVANIKNSILLAPIEMFGFQTVFCSLFSYGHNGGTWFISCLAFCYLIFPFAYQIISDISQKHRIILEILLVFVLLYSVTVVYLFNLDSIYSNPFFRVLEFILGIIVCCECCVKEQGIYVVDRVKRVCEWGGVTNWLSALCVVFTMLVSVSFFVLYHCKIPNVDYMMYNYIAIPVTLLLVPLLAKIKILILQKSKVFKYLVDISFVFFLAQFFTWRVSKVFFNLFLVERSLYKLLISFFICLVIAILLHEIIEKPITKYLRYKFLVKEQINR